MHLQVAVSSKACTRPSHNAQSALLHILKPQNESHKTRTTPIKTQVEHRNQHADTHSQKTKNIICSHTFTKNQKYHMQTHIHKKPKHHISLRGMRSIDTCAPFPTALRSTVRRAFSRAQAAPDCTLVHSCMRVSVCVCVRRAFSRAQAAPDCTLVHSCMRVSVCVRNHACSTRILCEN
jgi:hypothetical protein